MGSKMFISMPYFFGYEKAIKEAVELYSNYEVHLLVYDDYHFKGYENYGERIYSFVRKLLKMERYKDIVFHRNIRDSLIRFPDNFFDLYLGIRPDFMEDYVLDVIRKIAKKTMAYYWDSVVRAPRFRAIEQYFDTIFSYDPYDCDMYGYTFLTNFYLEKGKSDQKSLFNVFCFMAFDPYRIEIINDIIPVLEHYKLSYKIFIYKQRKSIIPQGLTEKEDVIIRRSPMLIDQVFENYSACNVVLDICNIGNKGLSLRTFEAMRLKKKLITTNVEIKNYPFYNSNNIFVLEDLDHQISKDFFLTPYEDVPQDIFKKYSFESWLSTLTTS